MKLYPEDVNIYTVIILYLNNKCLDVIPYHTYNLQILA